jgi:hypothetical protein
MLNRTFFKRIIPFILTFAVGLIIASFFVNIAPNFRFKKDSCGKRHNVKMLKQENKRLRWENEQLRNNRMDQSQDMYLSDELVPPPPPMAPMAPGK